ncbi:MAG: sigma-70 family RNA polymerase sigma factor [Proteobacteria bacterium]|nr:sigma-70 family RNA polymerase sigma factor [Pseudomonadota bacterium]
MNTGYTPPARISSHASPEVIDLLAVTPSNVPFAARVQKLTLSSDLEKKILNRNSRLTDSTYQHQKTTVLTADDEKELACEVLRHRHLFTERLLGSPRFRQAVLTVIQNIYLFRNRKIFFGKIAASVEDERQEALLLFSTSPSRISIPLAKTFQHLIVARVWNRIIGQSIESDFTDHHYSALLEVVERLNTLRNIYVLLTTGLVKKLASQINPLYKQSITYDDAVQIGAIGIARAAYRYHPSSGVRFSTFATHWVFREIQRQALDGRLIRISSNTVEGYAKARKDEDSGNLRKFSKIIESAASVDQNLCGEYAALTLTELSSQSPSPVSAFEKIQLRHILLQTIDQVLSQKSGDIIKRRFGLPPYEGREQSILSISEVYRVTRSSIYQLEQTALKKLHLHLRKQLH